MDYNYLKTFLRAICGLLITILWTISCNSTCEEAKRLLADNRKGLKTNDSVTWSQLKFWISGNDGNCLKYLLNDTKDISDEKLFELLRKDVFKEDEGVNKTGKNCSPRRRRNRKGKNKKRRPGGNRNPGKNPQQNPGKQPTANRNPQQNRGRNPHQNRNVTGTTGKPKNK